jgi:hypothetical protein
MNKENKFYYRDGTISGTYYNNRILHRVDGPAIGWANGVKGWYVDGRCHRVDGPAIEWANGVKCWYIDDTEHTEQDFNIIIEEVNKMSTAMKLTDPRWWVRELGEKEIHEQGK